MKPAEFKYWSLLSFAN